MEISNFITFLKINDLFKDFSEEELLSHFKVPNYKICKYTKGEIVHFESEKCTSLDLILSGNVIVQKIDIHGKVLTITEFSVGENMGGNLMFSNYPDFPMSIIAKTDSLILHINRNLVLDLCQKNKKFLLKFLACNSDKTAILTHKIKSISHKSIRESIIDFLNYEYYSQNKNPIRLSLTKKELAEKMGISRTSLSRELQKMKNDDLLDYNNKYIRIIDLSILKT
ncbi:CRP-like cAMP-binding protein [Acetoanaerobium pronyense]|uniref:CRP-like cAMP-binding protein n=1 Tax=Acetoanaerobium pronyense TaxID=1482736 RepID=A0ABS4KM67_9FIRM|nr:Crp/Fnr family transcriptional regulator [Acetoanaerobium pronyense]MBP2028871.1 CRP-like cAMP-binding protein [Acetoanaerobium pronyense]